MIFGFQALLIRGHDSMTHFMLMLPKLLDKDENKSKPLLLKFKTIQPVNSKHEFTGNIHLKLFYFFLQPFV
jgi:hypothetical protein